MVEKYKEKFNNNALNKFIFNLVLNYENDSNKLVLDWDKNDLLNILKNLKSTSTGTLSSKSSRIKDVIKKIYDFEGKEYNEKKFIIKNSEMEEIIDYNRLMRLTLSPEQYENILSQISDINVRDRVLFELAWIGLTSEEIKFLKEKDIEILNNSSLLINLKNDKVFRVDDKKVYDDIKLCMQAYYYKVTTRNGRSKLHEFKFSEYLLKPVAVGLSTSCIEDNIDNPSLVLKAVLLKNYITCEGIDVTELNIEDIRRSKIIYLLSLKNVSISYVKNIFDLKKPIQLYWYKKISELKYK